MDIHQHQVEGVAGARRLYTVTPDGTVSDWVEIIPERTTSRLNDGGCDPAGRGENEAGGDVALEAGEVVGG